MEKNKSIDGLTPKHSKVSAATKSVPPKSKTSTAKPKSSVITKASKPTKSANNTNVSKPNPKKPVKAPKSNPVEDFLKPVQAFDFDESTGELKPREKSTADTAPKTNDKPPKPHKKRKAVLIIVIVLLLLIIGVATGFILWGNDIIAKITGGRGTVFDLISFTEPTYNPLKTDANGRTNILAFGTSGYNMEGDEGNGKHAGAQLTDSIMVISLNQETGDIAMLSLPRDLKASPTCTATGKINEVYWCNNMKGDNEQAGAEALMTEVGSILGIDFQYYAHLNWGSLVQIVDILGGITVTLDEDVNDRYWTGAVFQAGVPYTINGEQALGLARARHGTTSGDFTRGASQQKILIGIKDKLLEKNLSISDLLSLASTLGDNLRTSFSIDEMKTLAHLTSSFDFESMRQISLIEPIRLMTTGNINGISYVLPSAGVGNYGRIQEYVAKMLSEDPRNYEESTILVLNGTETTGLASTEKASLEKAGYHNIDIDDAPEGECTEHYTLYALSSTAPGTKKLLEKKYNQTAKTLENLPANIPTTYDFVIIIGADNN